MTASSALPDVVERSRREERVRAMRALLARPLLRGQDPGFPLVRRHGKWLRDWLARETGWGLRIEADFARLQKVPADLRDGTRPAEGGAGADALPFNRRRYALLCLALADLERGDTQITLGRLGDSLLGAAADPDVKEAGLVFTLDNRSDRRDLVAVVRLLLKWGALERVAGDEEAFVRQGLEKDVLYDVKRPVLAALLVTSRGPSLVELDGRRRDIEARLASITESFVPDTPEGRNRALRHRLTRRLLDDPVVYFDELDQEERDYLTRQRAAIVRRIEEITGLFAEVRAEGIAMVDPQGSLTDEKMPSEGTEGHATLLLADLLAQSGDEGLSMEAVHEAMRRFAEAHRTRWRRSAREPGAERDLCAQALGRLRALRLVSVRGDRVCPRPALHRFALEAPELPRQQDLLVEGA